MSKKIDELLDRIITKADLKLGLVTKKNFKEKPSDLPSFKRQISHSVFEDSDYPVDAIYFSGENPFIHFKKLSTFDPERVLGLHKKIWNEGRTPLLAIITPQEIRLYDCFDTPQKDDQSLTVLERERFKNTEKDLQRLCELIHQSRIDSGIIWKEDLGRSIKTQNRVDRKLVKNLEEARKELFKKYNFPFEIIHDLLGRSLFTLYLEDRGILTPENYPSRPKGVYNFFELLDDFESTYNLFHYLKEKFNGDLFPVTTREIELVKKYPNCLNLVKLCFSGFRDISTDQYNIGWRMFQFQYIPIELISSIYEEFISEEDEEKKKIRKDGAFYTPQMLVEFVLNEVLPYPDDNNANQRYNLKILDPACGSGIFLVESYKRLIARWKYGNPGKKITQDILQKLLLENIFGVEKNPEAVKVAAFSLYLTLLNYLEPKKVLSQVKFVPLIRWKDKKELKERKDNKPGNNLFQYSTFTKNLELLEYNFDIIIGNPPWKMGKLDDDVKKYCAENKLPQQIVCAYLHYMPEFTLNGTISLISSAKILFNTGMVYDNFRRQFFIENSVEAIVNLSVVRDIIFKNATSPGAIFIYRKRNHEAIYKAKDYVTYCVPKSIETIKNRQSIVIDSSEIKFLPVREILKENSKIFKIAMWGNARDLKLIEKFNHFKTLKETIPLENCATALHKAENKKGNPHLKDFLFFSTEKIRDYYVLKNGLNKLGKQHEYFRPIKKDIFKAPVVIVKEGTKDGNICSAYIGFNCAYKAATLGIKLKGYSKNHHKALTAFINSSFNHYFVFITSSSWGVDKAGRNQNNSILGVPAIIFGMSKNVINTLSFKVDEIISIRSSNEVEMNENERIKYIQNEIDEILYKELKLSTYEKALINDVLNYSVALHKRYKESNAEGVVEPKNGIVPYVKALAKTINSFLKHSKKSVWVEIIEGKNQFETSRLIAIHLNNNHNNDLYKITKDNNVSKLLYEINKFVYEEHSESIYYRKIVKYYKNKKNTIYLIKPNQKRFWCISQALNDADNIILDLVNNR